MRICDCTLKWTESCIMTHTFASNHLILLRKISTTQIKPFNSLGQYFNLISFNCLAHNLDLLYFDRSHSLSLSAINQWTAISEIGNCSASINAIGHSIQFHFFSCPLCCFSFFFSFFFCCCCRCIGVCKTNLLFKSN